MIDFGIQSTEGHTELRDAVRKLCSDFGVDYWERYDRDHRFAREFYEAFAAAGWLGMMVPEEYGGGGAGISEVCAVMEEVASSGGALNACTTVHATVVGMAALVRHGSEELKRKYLPAMANGELYMSFGVTEPDAGTDTTRITTKALRTETGYVVNGRKTWNSGAQEASKILLLVRTDPYSPGEKTKGMSLLVADINAPSVTIQPIAKIGRNAVDSNDVYFDNHPVEASDLVGDEGLGFKYLLSGLNAERIILASESIGIGRWSLAAAVRYAKERQVFDRPIGQNQSVQHPLAVNYMKLVSAASIVARAAAMYDSGASQDVCGPLANTAKYLASEAAFQTADDAMQTHGGYAFAREFHIGRYWIESRLQRIAPVNNQMILNNVAERVLDLPRSY
jgi:acyl-CoA dehydrogenase